MSNIERKMNCVCNSESQISNVCNTVEGHCLQAMTIVYHHANGHFDWLISEHRSVIPSRARSNFYASLANIHNFTE